MTDYKQLCVELLAALENEGYAHWIRHTPDEDELCLRARTALAESEPKEPTPQPVPVSEHLPGPGDRNSDGKCWWFCFECPGEHSYWILAKEVYCDPTYWLPAHALPLPS
jgi:hypothetical protein